MKKYLVAAVLIASFATPALAEQFWVGFDGKRCEMFSHKPDGGRYARLRPPVAETAWRCQSVDAGAKAPPALASSAPQKRRRALIRYPTASVEAVGAIP